MELVCCCFSGLYRYHTTENSSSVRKKKVSLSLSLSSTTMRFAGTFLLIGILFPIATAQLPPPICPDCETLHLDPINNTTDSGGGRKLDFLDDVEKDRGRKLDAATAGKPQVDFEGVGDLKPLAGYYKDYDFDTGIALVSKDKGGSGVFEGNPSGSTVAFFLSKF